MSEKKTMELSDYLSLSGLELHAEQAKALEDALAAALERLEQAEVERETGFTWGDDQGIEWLVIERDSGPWLFRRHPDGQFMSIREVRRITRKEAARASYLGGKG